MLDVTYQPGPRFHRRNPSPARPAPTPPPATVSVANVAALPGEPKGTAWTFSAPIDDPTGDVADLAIDGEPGIDWLRAGPATLHVWYDVPIFPGQPWSNPKGRPASSARAESPWPRGTGPSREKKIEPRRTRRTQRRESATDEHRSTRMKKEQRSSPLIRVHPS